MIGRVVCAHCKKVVARKETDDKGSDTHTICLPCMAKELGVSVKDIERMIREEQG